MKHKMAALALILLVAASFGAAKEKTKKTGESGGWGFFGPYAAMFNFDDLNAHLSAAPFHFTDKFAKNQFMFGGGGMAVTENISIGGYGFGGHQTVHSDTLRIRLAADYGGGMFEIGWLPLATKYIKLGPAVGMGGAGFTLRSTNAKDFEPNFDDLLLKGAQTWEITNSSFTLAPALNIMIPVKWAGIYLKVGYLLTLFDRDWNAGSIELSNAPNLRSSGVFASVQVMLGGSSKSGTLSAKAEYKPDDEKEDKDKDDQDKDNEDEDENED